MQKSCYPMAIGQKTFSKLSTISTMKGLGIATILLVISFLLLFGRIEWPGLHVDAPLYTTASINVARGFGWHYGGYTDRLLWKPEALYDHHGVLQVVLYGSLLKTSDWFRYNAVTTLINILTYLLYTFLLARTLRRTFARPRLPLAACAALLPTLLQLGVQGRPEHLVTPLIALPYLAYELTGSARSAYWASLPTAVLLFLTSPMVGLMFLGMATVLLLAWKPLRAAIAPIALLLLGTLLLASILLGVATPFQLPGWIRAISEASKVWVLTFPIEGTLATFKSTVWGASFPSLAWNWTAVFLAFTIVFSLIQGRRWLALLVFLFMGYFLADRTSDYAYIAFFPLAWLVFCNTALSRQLAPIQLLSPRDHRRWIVAITGVYLAWFLSYGAISSALALSQTDADHARALIQQQIQVDAREHDEDPSEAGVAMAYKFMHTPSFVALGTPFEQRGVSYVDSDGIEQAVCRGNEMQTFEDTFKVDFRYYLHPLHVSLLFPNRTRSRPMPPQLCVGGQPFQRIAGPLNTNMTPWGRWIPARFKDHYAFALYRRSPTQVGDQAGGS
jgi:hypothetical protein